MAEEDGSIGWYRPRVRAIIPIRGFHASRSLHKSASRYEWEFDQDFDEIIEACSERDETWISSEIKLAYSRLFKL